MSGDVHGGGAASCRSLDAVGNTTKAITKGIAIATAVLAATALFGAFREAVTGAAIDAGQTASAALADLAQLGQYLGVLDVANPRNLVGLLIGASVVFLFSGLAINAVSRAAGAVIYEVRRQFRDHPGIMAGTEKPEYGKVVDIVTRDSLRELSTPGLLAVLTPIAVGFGLGIGALGALPGRHHRHRHPHGRVPGQLRRRLGQRQEVREDGRLGARTPRRTRPPSSATPWRPVQGHRRSGHQPAAQGDEPGGAADRPAVVSMTLKGQTTQRLLIALLATAVVMGSVIASGRHRGAGEDIIDAIAEDLSAQRTLDGEGAIADESAGRER